MAGFFESHGVKGFSDLKPPLFALGLRPVAAELRLQRCGVFSGGGAAPSGSVEGLPVEGWMEPTKKVEMWMVMSNILLGEMCKIQYRMI
jgi:hypothetical protein